MRSVGQIGMNSSPISGAGSASSSGAVSGAAASAAFQKTAPSGIVAAPSGRGSAGGLGGSLLSSQTASMLMQEQDVSLLQGHGGGGGHGGGMKMMMRGVEAENAAQVEEAQPKRKRSKLASLIGVEDPQTAKEADGEEASEETANERDVWGWLKGF